LSHFWGFFSHSSHYRTSWASILGNVRFWAESGHWWCNYVSAFGIASGFPSRTDV
jgi:hypothetical protein